MWVKETYRTCASLRAAYIPARLLAEFWTPMTMCLYQISGERETTGIMYLCVSVCAWAWLCFKLWPWERKSNRKEVCALGRDGAMCMCVWVTVCVQVCVCALVWTHACKGRWESRRRWAHGQDCASSLQTVRWNHLARYHMCVILQEDPKAWRGIHLKQFLRISCNCNQTSTGKI